MSLAVLLWLFFAQPDAHVGRGYQFIQDERFEEAAKEFQAALALNPNLPRARYQLAICLFSLGRREEARKEFERLSRESGADPSIDYYLGRLDLVSGDFLTAIKHLQPLADDPPFPDTAFYLGWALLSKGDLKSATEWLEKAAQLTPRDFRVPYRLARTYQQTGRTADAEKQYALSTGLRENYNEAARQALTCGQALQTKPIEEARSTCRRLFDPNDPDKLTTLGMLYGQNHKYAEAVEPLEQAARLDPDSFEVFHNLGLTYFRLRRYANARAPLEKAVALRPDFFGSNAVLGATLYALKDDEAAYRALDHAHQLNPPDQDTADLLFKVALFAGQKHLAAGDVASGKPYLRKAAELHPQDIEVQRLLRAHPY